MYTHTYILDFVMSNKTAFFLVVIVKETVLCFGVGE